MVTQYWPNPFAKGIDLFDAIKHWKVNGFYIFIACRHKSCRFTNAKCIDVYLKPKKNMFIYIFSILRSVDLSTTTDSKQFQELLLERTKAFAAQTEALKSSNSDGKFSTFKTLSTQLFRYTFWSSITLFFHHQIKNQKESFIFSNPRIVTLFLSLCSNLWLYILSYCLHLLYQLFN